MPLPRDLKAHLDAIADRNTVAIERAKRVRLAAVPCVGVFFWVYGTVYAYPEPVTEMKPVGDWVSGSIIHYQIWPSILLPLAANLFKDKKHLIADLKEAHLAIPRGRVVYNKAENCSTVFLGPDIPDTVRAEIVGKFNLGRHAAEGRVKWDTADEHYIISDQIRSDFEQLLRMYDLDPGVLKL
jgi:hypothetical protein